MTTKLLLIMAFVYAISTSFFATIFATRCIHINDTEYFDSFKEKYNRKYSSHAEEQKRKYIFEKNIKMIQYHQLSNPFATFGVNQFADMTADEFKIYHNAEKYYSQIESYYGSDSSSNSGSNSNSGSSSTYTNHSINWVDRGVVTAVKNQGQCGSCWSFSTTGNIEGQWAIKTQNLISLSEQELVSCSSNNDGCNGGMMDNAFIWLLRTKRGWISSEETCPYVSGDGQVPSCDYLSTSQKAAKISGYKNIPHDEVSMSEWLYTNGPVSIGVDASSWQFYMGGVMTNCNSTQVDHGVLLVGFDDFHNPPYWIIKNSWGPGWGENGYIRVAKWTNQCLITTAPCTSQV
jgi:cysteine peptidase B